MASSPEKPTHESQTKFVELVDAFDEAWHGEEKPIIEIFLDRIEPGRRAELLVELLAIEWEYRLKRKHAISWPEYAKRFPEAADWMERHWCEVLASLRPPANGEKAAQTSKGRNGTEGDGGGNFRIDGVWARGGIGEVLLAWDRTLRRQVAVKIIQADIAGDHDIRRRFRREAEVIGSLEHPGIIPIYCFGQFGNREPYYAMRLVKDGETLEARIARAFRQTRDETEPTEKAASWDRDTIGYATIAGASLAPTLLGDGVTQPTVTGTKQKRPSAITDDRRRSIAPEAIEVRFLLERFLMLADTVAFSHDRGVIHRDIKPANVILGPFGETFLVDWGLALLEQPGDAHGEENSEFGTFSDSTFQNRSTATGSMKGTPAYCPPEQARNLPCGRACDVYSLGATLYHIMLGCPPRDGHGSESDAVEAAKENRFVQPRLVRRDLDKAMEAIILKAMATLPRNRYATAKELGEDVRRWMADERVHAWNEPRSRTLSRFARRHRKAARILALASVATVAIGLKLHDRFRDLEERERMNQIELNSAALLVTQRDFVKLAAEAEDAIERRNPNWSAQVDSLLNSMKSMRIAHPRAVYPSVERLIIARNAYSDLARSALPKVSTGMTASEIVPYPQGDRLFVAEFKKSIIHSTAHVKLVDTTAGAVVWHGQARMQTHFEQDGFRSMAVSPDGQWLVAGTRYGQIFVWHVEIKPGPAKPENPALAWNAHDGKEVARLVWPAQRPGASERFYSMGALDQIASWDWTAIELAMRQGKAHEPIVPKAQRTTEHRVHDIVHAPNLAPDDSPWLVVSEGSVVRLLDPESLKDSDRAAPIDIGEPAQLACHPSGLIVVAKSRSVALTNPMTGSIVRELSDPQIGQAHRGQVHCLRITDDGQYAITYSGDEMDRRLKMWNLHDPRDLVRLFRPGASSFDIAVCLQERDGGDGAPRLWLSDERSIVPFDLVEPTAHLVAGVAPGALRGMAAVDAETPRFATIAEQARPGRSEVTVYDATNQIPILKHAFDSPPSGADFDLAFSTDGRDLAISARGQPLRILRNVDRPNAFREVVVDAAREDSLVRFDDAGALIGYLDEKEKITVLPPGSERLDDPGRRDFSDIGAQSSGLGTNYALTTHARRLYAGGRDGAVRVWNTEPGAPNLKAFRSWRAGAAPIFCTAISGDGKWLVCGTQSGALHVIDTASVTLTPANSVPDAHADIVTSVALATFDDTGTHWVIASGCQSGTIRLWKLDAATGEISPLASLTDLPRTIRRLSFLSRPEPTLLIYAEGQFGLTAWSIRQVLRFVDDGAGRPIRDTLTASKTKFAPAAP